jgi:hypothetical protein
MHMAHDREQRRALVSTVMDLLVPQKTENYLTGE